jgi:hypothetical protein
VAADTVSLGQEAVINGDTSLIGRQGIWFNGRVNGDLTAMADRLIVGKDGVVVGDLTFMGQEIMINGTIQGDLTVVGDLLLINRGAVVRGQISACVKQITNHAHPDLPIHPCSRSETLAALGPLWREGAAALAARTLQGGFSSGGLLFSVALSLALTGLSALLVTVFPRQFSHVSEALLLLPRRMAGVGCLAALMALGIGGGVVAATAVASPVGLALLPFGLVVGLALLALVVMGWMALALVLGDWLLRRITRAVQPPLIAVLVGSIALFALWHALALIPFGPVVGLVLMAALGSAGLGAALVTRLGTRPVRRRYFVQG